MSRLAKIIEELKKVEELTDLEVSNDTLFTGALKLFISERIEAQRQNYGKKPFKPQEKARALATEKQLALLKKLKVNAPEGLTKIEAIGLIKEVTSGGNST